MSETGWLLLYSLLILAVSLFGGYLPFFGQVTHRRMQFYLSVSAGVMLGASFFHVMPEAMALSGGMFGWWMTLGVVGVFCIERFLAPHTHESEPCATLTDKSTESAHTLDHAHRHGHAHSHGHSHSDCDDPAHGVGGSKTTAAPPVAGWMAVLGLTIHTFMNGVGLAGAVSHEAAIHSAGGTTKAACAHSENALVHYHGSDPNVTGLRGWLARLGIPGFALFLAIALHKPADALAVSMVLARKGVSRTGVLATQIGFASMVPVGAILFYWVLGEGGLTEYYVGPDDAPWVVWTANDLTGAALSISAGTFLFIALSDLLPEVQFHTHDRGLLLGALAAGLGLMGFIGYLEGHRHGHGHGHGHGDDHSHTHDHDHTPMPPKKRDDCCDHDHDHDHDHGSAASKSVPKPPERKSRLFADPPRDSVERFSPQFPPEDRR